MCVIAVCEKRHLTEKEITDMWASNSSGAGVGWFEGKINCFKKGIMKLKELKELLLGGKIPLPCVVHFRLASSGKICRELTHPFIISKTSELLTEGKTQQKLLFHNGHWVGAQDKYIEVIIRKDLKVAKGEFSDTRIIAIMASIYGLNFLRLINDKFVVMNRGKIIYFGQFVKKDGIVVSNDYWDKRFGYYNYGGYIYTKGDYEDVVEGVL